MIRSALDYFYDTYREILDTIVNAKLDDAENKLSNYTDSTTEGIELIRSIAKAEGLSSSEGLISLVYYLTLAHYNLLTETELLHFKETINTLQENINK